MHDCNISEGSEPTVCTLDFTIRRVCEYEMFVWKKKISPCVSPDDPVDVTDNSRKKKLFVTT